MLIHNHNNEQFQQDEPFFQYLYSYSRSRIDNVYYGQI